MDFVFSYTIFDIASLFLVKLMHTSIVVKKIWVKFCTYEICFSSFCPMNSKLLHSEQKYEKLCRIKRPHSRNKEKTLKLFLYFIYPLSFLSTLFPLLFNSLCTTCMHYNIFVGVYHRIKIYGKERLLWLKSLTGKGFRHHQQMQHLRPIFRAL